MSTGSRRGVTLLEVLIAVTLLALLSGGMLTLMHIGFSAYTKVDAKLMDNRRVAGAQRIIEQQIEGFLPTWAICSLDPSGAKTAIPFFQGEAAAMRMVSTFSLQQAWRGRPQVLEFAVIPGEGGRGFRLVVNETPYNPELPGTLCGGRATDPATGLNLPRFLPVETGPRSFVLADKLAGVRFSYLEPPVPPTNRERWVPVWVMPRWPLGIRIDLAPLEVDGSRLQPVGITVPLHVTRSPEIQYVD